MRVFITGASGFIGLAVTKELIEAGHSVLGLARSEEAAKAVAAAGADVQRGSLEDFDSLRAGAEACNTVIHCAFIHDFTKFAENCKADKAAIDVLGAAILGTNKPMLVTSGIGVANLGRPAVETDEAFRHEHMPRVSEFTALEWKERGVNVAVVRLPQVHDRSKQGLITYMVAAAKEKKAFPYLGAGENRYCAIHISDCARLYRLALEKIRPGARYHAVGEVGVSIKDIAETVARSLNVPAKSITQEQAPEYLGPIAMFLGMDMPASSEITQKELDWKPTGPSLLSDLKQLQLV